jgi:hypothetical protein
MEKSWEELLKMAADTGKRTTEILKSGWQELDPRASLSQALTVALTAGVLNSFAPALAPLITPMATDAHAASDKIVYSVYRGVDLGIPNEPTPKDFFVNMGSADGLKPGTTLDVFRKIPTYDVTQEKVYRDVTFPIAKLKVIHVEEDAAIARLERMLPLDQTPSLSPRAVMVGDYVRVGSK